MKKTTQRVVGVAAGAVIATLGFAGCSSDNNSASSATSAAAGAASAAKEAASSVVAGASSAVAAASSAIAGASTVELTAADGTKVTLSGPIAVKYSAATAQEKTDLGAPKTGPNTSGTESNGVVYQQFAGGVITAKNGDSGTPAYITWGKIRDAWNVPRDAEGKPEASGKGGSMGPLGTATSDETDADGVKTSTFEHGKITWNSATNKVEVTVNGKVVPTE